MNCSSRLILIFPLLLTLVFQSCKSLRKGKGQTAEKAWKTTLDKTAKERVEYKTLQLSGKAQLNIPNMGLNNMGVNFRVSMEKDKRIWIRVSKIIEAARILARPDSLFVIDKFNRKYMACDYSLAKDFTGLDMDFQLLQDMILGNFHPIPEDLSPGLLEGSMQSFSGSKAGTDFTYTLDNLLNKVAGIEAKNQGLNQNTKISYGEFEATANTSMPRNTLIEVLSPDNITVELSYRKVEINPASISFSFKPPSNYAKQGCK